MSATTKMLQAVRELMATVRERNAELNREIRHDYICGRWEHDFYGIAASIIKMNTGYMACIFINDRVVEQMFFVPMGEALEINDCAGVKPVRIYFDSDRQALFIGKYGRFSRDHTFISCEEWDELFADSGPETVVAEKAKMEIPFEKPKKGRKKQDKPE